MTLSNTVLYHLEPPASPYILTALIYIFIHQKMVASKEKNTYIHTEIYNKQKRKQN